MLYIKTTATTRRMNIPDAITMPAEDAHLFPSYGLKKVFELDWNDQNLFTRSDITPDGLRCRYEQFRRTFRKELSTHIIALESIQKIIETTQSGKDIILTVKENRPFQNSVRRILVELFHEKGVSPIQADKNIEPRTVRLMDALTTDPAVNTAVSYKYTNNEGRTATTRSVFIGAISHKQIMEILTSCKNKTLFVPESIGLPLNRPGKHKPGKDGAWAEFEDPAESRFQLVNEIPDNECTVASLVELFTSSKPYWDVMANTQKLMNEKKI